MGSFRSMARHRRPAEGECEPYYAGYFPLVPDGDVVATLRVQGARHLDLLAGLAPDVHGRRYAPGKWSVKELVGHLLDTEWIFTVRALCFARGDPSPFPWMDADVFVAGGGFDRRPMESLLGEYRHLRAAGTALFEGLDEEAFERRGIASGREFTVRSLLWFLAGHELHHVRVLQERYLRTEGSAR